MAQGLLDRYAGQVRNAWRDRRDAARPKLTPLVVFAAIGLTAYVTHAIMFVPRGEDHAYHFTDERGSITALSSVSLAMASAFSFAAFYVPRRLATRERLFWLLLTLAFGFLALDELIEVHERLGLHLDRADPLGLVSRWGFRNWNDLVIIGYGVVALPVLIYFLPTALRYPRCLETLLVAFAFYGAHTIIDATQEPATVVSQIMEETCKVCTSVCLAIGAFAGCVAANWNQEPHGLAESCRRTHYSVAEDAHFEETELLVSN
jgi:hypothetical protein